jgi:hypothetical protein
MDNRCRNFHPCAASRLVAQSQIDSLIANGRSNFLWCQCSFADKEIFFWANHGRCRPKVNDPDFILIVCGMARVLLTSWKKSTNDRPSHFPDPQKL